MAKQKISPQQLNTVLGSVSTYASEGTYTPGVWTTIPGLSADFKTTAADQSVTVFARMQTYQGGYSSFQFYVDGVAIGDQMKSQTGINTTTTGMIILYDWFTVATAGSHTMTIKADSAAGTPLRIIHVEGAGKMSIISGGA